MYNNRTNCRCNTPPRRENNSCCEPRCEKDCDKMSDCTKNCNMKSPCQIDCCDRTGCGCDALAIAFVKWQTWQKPLPACDGLAHGTIFPGLILPFYGCRPNKHQGGMRDEYR